MAISKTVNASGVQSRNHVFRQGGNHVEIAPRLSGTPQPSSNLCPKVEQPQQSNTRSVDSVLGDPARDPNAPSCGERMGQNSRPSQETDLREPEIVSAVKISQGSSSWSSLRSLADTRLLSVLAGAGQEVYETQLFNFLDALAIGWSILVVVFTLVTRPAVVFVNKLLSYFDTNIDYLPFDPPRVHSSAKDAHVCEHGNDSNAEIVCWARVVIASAPDDASGVKLDPQITTLEGDFLSWKFQTALSILRRFPWLLTHFKNRAALLLTARTLLFDDLYATAIRNLGVRQIVLLGAGYDTRAQRFASLRRRFGVRVIEIDQLPVQRRKIDCLHKVNVVLPATSTVTHTVADVGYYSCNLESPEALRDVLEAARFNPELTTAFFMEGVVYYLSAEAFYRTLSTIARFRLSSKKPVSLSPPSSATLDKAVHQSDVIGDVTSTVFFPEWYFYFDYWATPAARACSNPSSFSSESFPTATHKLIALGMSLQSSPIRLTLPASRLHLTGALSDASSEIKVDRITSFLKAIDRYCPHTYSLFRNVPFALAECRWSPKSLP